MTVLILTPNEKKNIQNYLILSFKKYFFKENKRLMDLEGTAKTLEKEMKAVKEEVAGTKQKMQEEVAGMKKKMEEEVDGLK